LPQSRRQPLELIRIVEGPAQGRESPPTEDRRQQRAEEDDALAHQRQERSMCIKEEACRPRQAATIKLVGEPLDARPIRDWRWSNEWSGGRRGRPSVRNP
jgi:hypothetical protein